MQQINVFFSFSVSRFNLKAFKSPKILAVLLTIFSAIDLNKSLTGQTLRFWENVFPMTHLSQGQHAGENKYPSACTCASVNSYNIEERTMLKHPE